MFDMRRREFITLLTGAAAAWPLAAVSRIARAQSYPSRPIRLVVPFPPGGAFDAIGRPWAEKMKPVLGTVVVENIGGGGASLGAAAVARSRPAFNYPQFLPPRARQTRCRLSEIIRAT